MSPLVFLPVDENVRAPETVSRWIGIDVGWVYPAADSDGVIHRWSRRDQRRAARRGVTWGGPVTITKVDGTTHEEEPPSDEQLVLASMSEWDFEDRCRRLASTVVAKARQGRAGLALEDFGVFDDRDRSSRWEIALSSIRELCRVRRVRCMVVNPAYTSQTCPGCGHCDRGNRPERNDFLCQQCHYYGQADVVAAMNIAARAEAKFLSDPTLPIPGEGEKVCSQCDKIKTLPEFYRNSRGYDGRTSACRDCVSVRQRQAREVAEARS